MPKTTEMVEVKTADLDGLALDWAVDAIVTKKPLEVWHKEDGSEWIFVSDGMPFPGPDKYSSKRTAYGPTHLIAAMRCIVASEHGDSILVPAVLLR